MTVLELVRRAIDTALIGMDKDPNMNVYQSYAQEVGHIADQAIKELAVEVAAKPELRAQLEKTFSVTLTTGVGSVPAGMLVEYLHEGSVRDADAGANGGLGNILQKVNHYDDLINPLPSIFGYYCVKNKQFHTRQVSTGSFTATASPLTVDAPFLPTSANLNADVPDELVPNLVEMLAVRIRGIIPRMVGQTTASAPATTASTRK